MSAQTRTRRGWVIPAAVASAAVVASLAMGTLGAYTATINGENNLAGSGTLTMSESLVVDGVVDESTTVDTVNSGTGDNTIESTINRYGGNMAMVPGDSVSTTVQIENTSEVPGVLSLEVRGPAVVEVTEDGFAAVDPQPVVSLANVLQVTLENGSGAMIYNGSLSEFTSDNRLVEESAISLEAEQTEDFTFTITFPEGEEGADPALMGQDVQQGLTWTLTSTGAENEEVA